MNVFIRLIMESFLIILQSKFLFNFLRAFSLCWCKIREGLRKTTAQAHKILKISLNLL